MGKHNPASYSCVICFATYIDLTHPQGLNKHLYRPCTLTYAHAVARTRTQVHTHTNIYNFMHVKIVTDLTVKRYIHYDCKNVDVTENVYIPTFIF